jgi:hypothetical protein
MNTQDLLQKYVADCSKALSENSKILGLLRKQGITESFIYDSFQIGFADGSLLQAVGDNEAVLSRLEQAGLVQNGKEVLAGYTTIPVFDAARTIVNIVGYNPYPQSKRKVIMLNDIGIFNQPFLQTVESVLVTEQPLEALLCIQAGHPAVTFVYGSDHKYRDFFKAHAVRKVTFAFDGRARLFYECTSNGLSARRITLDIEQLMQPGAREYLTSLLSDTSTDLSLDTIQEIENGFLFQFTHLSYRVIGNFTDYAMTMKANVKVFTEQEVFVDSIDLYKNRDRQNFIYSIMDRFAFRDQVQLEQDLHTIMDVIEKHKAAKEQVRQKTKPELTEYQKDIGLRFLTNKQMTDEIDRDITALGYVRERKNKLLLYLLMTSRLLDNPLHAIIISRSGAGKSQLVDIVEKLCPPEELESISDLSPQALFYVGQDDLKHKLLVIGEKEGSKGSDYPLRELISKKSISKAIPMKDQTTGQIRTVNIKVNGPIALVETTTNGEINPENLNRCFVVGIDESEEQTRLIHARQRDKYTVDGYLNRRELARITEKHIYAQRLLQPVMVFNPYAPLLTFPSAKLKTRRDNEKLLRLITVICFLHQYQRRRKQLTIDSGEVVEYIECTVEDYRIAHDLLSDGVLDNTLDDLPKPARELLEHIKKYLRARSEQEELPVEKIIFDRKQIREYSSWSFAQVRNNFRILKDYEYIQLVKARNGVATQYRLSGDYSDLDFLHTILSPEELETRIKSQKAPAQVTT